MKLESDERLKLIQKGVKRVRKGMMCLVKRVWGVRECLAVHARLPHH